MAFVAIGNWAANFGVALCIVLMYNVGRIPELLGIGSGALGDSTMDFAIRVSIKRSSAARPIS